MPMLVGITSFPSMLILGYAESGVRVNAPDAGYIMCDQLVAGVAL